MTYHFDGQHYIVRLKKGELLMASLQQLAVSQGIQTAWISGIGGALWAELGIYNLETKQYDYKRFEEPLELTALQGNITLKDGEPFIHMHATASTRQLLAIGGHVREVCIGATCELMLHTIDGQPLTRQLDETIGLPLLDLPHEQPTTQ